MGAAGNSGPEMELVLGDANGNSGRILVMCGCGRCAGGDGVLYTAKLWV